MTQSDALDRINAAAEIVYSVMAPTPQYAWPLLCDRVGAEVWVKHENHTPAGAFKIRGGSVYVDHLRRTQPEVTGVIAATRGNHGQSVAIAARRAGLSATVVVPEGNSVEKNAAMRAWGGELLVHGRDFQESFEYAQDLAQERGLHMFASFHDRLVDGVATYGLELFTAAPDLEAVFVPIGLGSGICAVMQARDAVGSKAEVWGVVSETAPAYALSFAAGHPVSTNASSAPTIADGVDCRVPNAAAFERIKAGAAGIIKVSDAEIADAMRAYYTDTHNIAEGAGAVPLAGLMQVRDRWQGRKVGVILSGGNVDMDVYRQVLTGTS
ncbi:threonine dehydratase [Thalassobaculum sp.]|uniref:threonine dehydratase n=1 Tax=Thalassobaculum sp. TaxID=2022740 RepID=UPI003B5CF441